jgi:probable F420-dependent oxidoreductase
MHIGVTMFATDRAISPADLAREAEARGFDSLYFPEHTHIPVSRRTPPPTGEPVLPEEYKRTLDPFVALGAAAAVTSRIRLGTGICLVAQRDPIVTAKAVATLDHLSGGRFVLGVGVGWNEDEMESHGVDPRARRARAREHVLAMQRLWADDVASFTGVHVQVPPSWSWPKPVQRPWPPVLMGGAAGPKLFSHIAEYADGWMPIGGAGVAAAIPALHEAVRAAGRDPSKIHVVVFGAVPDEGKMARYLSLGVSEVLLRIPSAARDEVLPVLDRFTRWVGIARGAER